VALEAKPRRSILSRKSALVAAMRAGALPGDVTQVVVGATYPGYVASATQNAVGRGTSGIQLTRSWKAPAFNPPLHQPVK
jgi:hypothetical protein